MQVVYICWVFLYSLILGFREQAEGRQIVILLFVLWLVWYVLIFILCFIGDDVMMWSGLGAADWMGLYIDIVLSIIRYRYNFIDNMLSIFEYRKVDSFGRYRESRTYRQISIYYWYIDKFKYDVTDNSRYNI